MSTPATDIESASPPTVFVDPATCPMFVSWRRITPDGSTDEWHTAVLKRYKKAENPNEYIPTKFHAIRTKDEAVEEALKQFPPRLLKKEEGIWDCPVVSETIVPQAIEFPSFFFYKQATFSNSR